MDLSLFQRRRRFAIGALMVLVFLALLVVGSGQDETAHDVVETFGHALMVVGIVGRIWCTLYIGGRKSAEIIDIGPYSMTRNPLYVFSTVAATGVGAQTGSLTLAAVFGLGCALAFQPVIRREERFLVATFGAPYEAYLARVPRFLPRFKSFADQNELTIRTDRIYRTLFDGLVFFASIPVFEIVEMLQAGGRLPVLLLLP